MITILIILLSIIGVISILGYFFGDSVFIFIKRYWKKLLTLAIASGVVATGVVVYQPIEPPADETNAYDYWYLPENSFGIQEVKTTNWSYFKQLFLAHTDWALEYKRYSYSDWTDGSDYLTIERTWNDTGFWKFNLILDAPVDVYSARFTFGIDIPCLQYVERSNTEVWVNYSANATETYSCMFNWSDIVSIPGIVITKGKTNEMFWFRFRRDNIPAGHYEFDPTFGETSTTGFSSYGVDDDQIHGNNPISPASDGTADNISLYCRRYSSYLGNMKFLLYESDDTLVGVTDEVAITTSEDWYTASFSSPPNIYSSKSYYICFWLDPTRVYVWRKYLSNSASQENLAYGTPPNPISWDYEETNDYKFAIYCSYTEGVVENTAPTVDYKTPVNGTSGTAFSGGVTCYAYTNDADGDTLNITWATNESDGVNWVNKYTNTSEPANDTESYTFTDFDTANTKYWWKVYVNDGTVNISEIYHFTTGFSGDSTIIINFAGNLSDSGGPYWRSPGETTQLIGIWSDGYYTNDSRQQEDWIYINCTITNAITVYLDWLNETNWTNGTYILSNTFGNYWEINTSGTIQTHEGCNYSFNINASGLGGNTISEWNKTGVGGVYTRRYVQLNCTIINMSYIPYYFYNITYAVVDESKKDRLHHDQGSNVGNNDGGYLLEDVPADTVSQTYCQTFIGNWFDESKCIESIELTNMYFHIWWSNTAGHLDQIGWRRDRDQIPSVAVPYDYYGTVEADNRSTIYWDDDFVSTNNTYWLSTNYLVLDSGISREFTDNSIYEFFTYIDADASLWPSLVSNRSFTSFILFNVPDNTTLQGQDSDSDNLNDYEELYITYTNPFLADTDNDDVTDYNENISGSDPNNYTDTIAIYNTTIRCDGEDYFVWLGANVSAYEVAKNVTGLSTSTEYIAIWNLSSWNSSTDTNGKTWMLWEPYFGDATGSNWTVHTFDVVKVLLADSSTQLVNMTSNVDMSYDATRNQTLSNNATAGKGWSFVDWGLSTSKDLSTINTTVDLLYTSTYSEIVALWNETNYAWNYWFAGFPYNTNKDVHQWDVLMFKIGSTTNYLDTGDF